MEKPLVNNVPANSKMNWLHGDSEKAYNDNWAKKEPLMRRLGWTPDVKIEYCLDKNGFRNSHNKIDGSFLALGCSHTFGIGLPVHQTWPCLLGRQTNNSVFNAGSPGASMDAAFRILTVLLEDYRPKAVFCLAPLNSRWEFHYGDEFLNFGPWPWFSNISSMPNEEKNVRLVNELHIDRERCRLNQLKNRLAMTQLCDMNNIPFTCIERKEYHVYPRFKDDWGRDLAHQGLQWQTAISNHMESLYRRNNG